MIYDIDSVVFLYEVFLMLNNSQSVRSHRGGNLVLRPMPTYGLLDVFSIGRLLRRG